MSKHHSGIHPRKTSRPFLVFVQEKEQDVFDKCKEIKVRYLLHIIVSFLTS